MIKEIKWDSHPVLGDLSLDFTKPNEDLYNTIIFAGENGCGKTTILSTLSTFLNLRSFEPFSHIRYCVDGTVKLIRKGEDINSRVGFHMERSMLHCQHIFEMQ